MNKNKTYNTKEELRAAFPSIAREEAENGSVFWHEFGADFEG